MVDGRYPIKLVDTGDQVGLKPKNIEMVRLPSRRHSMTGDDWDNDDSLNLSNSYKLVKMEHAKEFLTSQGFSTQELKQKLKHPDIKAIIIQDGGDFNMTFISMNGAVVDDFYASSGLPSNSSKSATLNKDELIVTDISPEGKRRYVVFKKPDKG